MLIGISGGAAQSLIDNQIEIVKINQMTNKKISIKEMLKFKGIGMTLYEAMLLDVKLLILDEPDNNIDPDAFNKIMINIGNEFNDTIILFTTHKGKLLNLRQIKFQLKILIYKLNICSFSFFKTYR